MPQKLNKAGKMQDYIPKGNGDASGEYGTSNGTNKNFTTSDKKSSKANVITENKSVVVGDKKAKDYTITKESIYNKKNDKNFDYDVIDKLPDGWGKIDGALTAPNGYVWVNNKKSLWDKDYQQAIIKKELLETPNKANIIDGDLSGKKDNYLNKEIAKLTGLSEKEISNTIKEMGFASSNDKTQDYYEMALQKKYNLPKYAEIKEEKHDKAWYEKADDNYAKAEQHLYTKQQEYENMPEIKQFYEKMGKDILRERKLIYDKLKEFNK